MERRYPSERDGTYHIDPRRIITTGIWHEPTAHNAGHRPRWTVFDLSGFRLADGTTVDDTLTGIVISYHPMAVWNDPAQMTLREQRSSVALSRLQSNMPPFIWWGNNAHFFTTEAL